MSFHRALIALICAALAGCSTPADPLAGSTAFPDQHSVDWCSLADPEPLTAFGQPGPPEPKGFDACAIEITGTAETHLTAEIGAVDDIYPDRDAVATAHLPNGLLVTTFDDTPADSCQKLLTLRDGIRISVSAEATTSGLSDLCDVVDAVVANVSNHLSTGRTARPHPTDSPSARTADTCAATPREAITGLPGFGEVRPTTLPLAHRCLWTIPTEAVGRAVFVRLDETPDPATDTTTTRLRINEIELYITWEQMGACEVTVPIRPTPGNPATTEVVRAFLMPSSTSVDSCPAAARIALKTRAAILG